MTTTPGRSAAANCAVAAHRIVTEIETLERERLAFSAADVQGRVRVAALMADAGLTVRIDDAFNLFGRMEGAGVALPPIVVGSHLDTVSGPGRFDGTLGVLCALECSRHIAASGEPLRHPLVVSALSDEEGTATDCCWGSRALLGRLTEAERRALADESSPLSAKLAAAAAEFGRLGWDVQPRRLAQAAGTPFPLAAYLELHIEQGPALGPGGPAVAAVRGIAGVERFAVVFRGQAGHPATVPLERRAVAVLRAAAFVERYWAGAAAFAPRAVANIARLETAPGDLNVVPGEVRVLIEQRGLRSEVLAELETHLRNLAREHDGAVESLMRTAPVELDRGVRRLIHAAAAERGIECAELPSWAGHDAEEFATICPAGMISVRNAGGASHSPQERADEPDVATGLELLLATLRRVDDAR